MTDVTGSLEFGAGVGVAAILRYHKKQERSIKRKQMPKLKLNIRMMIALTTLFFFLTLLNVPWWIVLLVALAVLILPSAYIAYVYYYGAAQAMRGDLQAAINHYDRILKLPVDKVQIYKRRAALRNALGDVDGAIADYTAAMQRTSGEDAALYGVRSSLYLVKRDFEKALADSNQLLKLHPTAEVGYANRAAAKVYLGDLEGAIADCNAGLALNKSSSAAALLYNNRGTAHRMRSEFSEALADYNLAMSASLSDREKKMVHPSIITNQGILYYLQEEYEPARAYFQQAQNLNPAFYKALAGLAVARFKLGQLEEAVRLWRELISKEAGFRDATWTQREINWPMEMMPDTSALIEQAKTES